MKKKLRIAINAQLLPGGGAGGNETVLRVLTSLGRLDGDEEYVFIGHWEDDGSWLKPLLNERQKLVRAPDPVPYPPNSSFGETFKRLTGPFRPLARGVKRIFKEPPTNEKWRIPISGGFYESQNCDVIHFPYQDFVQTGIPSIYNPHDLQHLHFPQYFSPEEIQRREVIYPAACRAAHTVVAATQLIKHDIVDKYCIEAHKIQVITWGPPEMELKEFAEEDARTLCEKYGCPPTPFALYPAMTWEHKNHIRLLEAIAVLRDRERLKVNLVCTGHKNSFYPNIERRLNELRLKGQVTFVGVVEFEELSVLYRMAQFVIIPTLFEAASAPLLEAFQHDVAVACSAVTSLPEQAGGAAYLFNPFSVEEVAGALRALASDPGLNAELRSRGRERLKSLDPDRTAKSYRAVYRRAAGVRLTDEDRHLLDETGVVQRFN